MVEKYGDYEVSLTENYVRLKVGSDTTDYEYIVSEPLDGDTAHRKCRLFIEGFIAGKRDIRRSMRKLLHL